MTRWMRAVIVVLLFVTVGVVIDQTVGIVVPDVCKSLTPDNWFLWWYYGCDQPAPGGGGSGAG